MSKKKYIDYGKLLEERYRLGLDEMSRISKVNAFNHFIDTRPIADVEEVQHGYNKTSKNPVDEFWCSECGFCCTGYIETKYDEDGNYTYFCDCEFNFCPNCGAKMVKEQE